MNVSRYNIVVITELICMKVAPSNLIFNEQLDGVNAIVVHGIFFEETKCLTVLYTNK